MQLDLEQLIKHPQTMDKETLYDLRSLIALYPYFQTARLLMLQNLYILHDPSFDEELRKAAIYITDRKMIFRLIEAAHYKIKSATTDNSQAKNAPGADRTISLIDNFLDTIPATHKIYINTTFPAQAHTSFEEMLAFTERNKDKITCMNISRHLQHYVEESPDQVLGKIACPTRINCVLYKNYPAAKLVDYVERFLPYRIPIQFRYDYTETTPENLYEEEHDKILQDLKRLFTYKGLDGCRMRNGFHFEYKGLHMTYHKTLPYSTIEEKGPDGVTYDILYDILIKQNGEIHSDWTGVKMDVDAYRRVVFEPYDLKVLNGTIDF